jgi:hypothetical protein
MRFIRKFVAYLTSTGWQHRFREAFANEAYGPVAFAGP